MEPFLESVKNWLTARGVEGVDRVLGFKQDEYDGISCGEGTCWDIFFDMVIFYTVDGDLSHDNVREYTENDMHMADFIREVTNF